MACLVATFSWALSSCAPGGDSADDRPGVAYIVAFGPVPAAEVRRARLALVDLTGRSVAVLPARPLAPHLLSKPCRDGRPETPCPTPRYDASALLDAILIDAPADTYRILGITTAPVDAPSHDHLIGFARQGERGLVYSTHAQVAALTEAEHRRRVRHIVAHELGHTFGAGHCEEECVMHDVASIAEIAHLTEHPCPHHADDFSKGLAGSIDAPEFLSDLGSERLRLEDWSGAIDALGAVASAQPEDPRVSTALALAMMADGRLVTAEEVLEEASRRTPQAPQPYYARAVLYASGYAEDRASAFLEAAVARDGNIRRAHRAAGILYQDVLESPALAVRHFEAHIQHGGRDPEVIARLVYLLSPTTLTFDTGEVIIARWQPDEGLMIAAVQPRRR